MINLGAIGNFIYLEVILRARLKVWKKENLYPLFILDRSIIRDRKGIIS